MKKRPILVTLLAGYVFLLAGSNAAAVYAGLLRINVLQALNTSIPLWVVILARAVWAFIWLVALAALWYRRPWGRTLTTIAYPTYQVMLLVQWALFIDGGYERGRLAFGISYAVWSTALVLYILSRSKIRAYFHAAKHMLSPDFPHNNSTLIEEDTE